MLGILYIKKDTPQVRASWAIKKMCLTEEIFGRPEPSHKTTKMQKSCAVLVSLLALANVPSSVCFTQTPSSHSSDRIESHRYTCKGQSMLLFSDLRQTRPPMVMSIANEQSKINSAASRRDILAVGGFISVANWFTSCVEVSAEGEVAKTVS
jgi:hypothetical protein